MGERIRRPAIRAAVVATVIGMGLLAGMPAALADTTGPQVPFEAVVARARLVVVGVAHVAADGAVTIEIERVLAGTGPATAELRFEDGANAPDLEDGGRAVIAFADPRTIDEAAPTIAWAVTDDGYVDPAAVERVEDLPPTLAAVYTYFGQPIAEPRGGQGLGPSLQDALLPILLVLVALAAAEGGIAHRERRRAA